MAFSSFGKKRLVAHVALLLVNILVLALSVRVNVYQEYFFMADKFPLILSAISMVYLALSILLDLGLETPFTGKAGFELPAFGIFSIFWFAFDIFSTARWSKVPMACSSIPAEYADEIGWCKDVQALKAFTWIEFVGFFLTFAVTLRYVLTQHSSGNKHVWSTGLAHYRSQEQQSIYGFDAGYGGAVSSDMMYGGEKGIVYN